MSKEKIENIVIYGNDARKSLKEGIDIVANAVKVTLGAKGRNVLISNDRGQSPHITKDGVTVAKSIQVKDALQRQGALLIQEVAKSTNHLAGDGPQPLYTKILTPEGVKKLSEIKVGDILCGTNSSTQEVLGVFRKGNKTIYHVVFSDGRFVECCEEHLWTVKNKNGLERTLTTLEMFEEGVYKTHKNGDREYNFYTPSTKVFFKEQEINLDPYLVGVLLGDGSLNSESDIEISLGLNKEHILEKLVLPKGLFIKTKWVDSKNYFRVKIKGQTENGKTIKDYLSEIGLLNTKSKNKFIPDNYKFNSFENREKLLQGLLDTDGYLNGRNLYEFSSVSPLLSQDFSDLMRGLGRTVRCKLHERDGNSYSKTPIFRVTELKGYNQGDKIIDITDTGESTEMMCIKVSNDDNLYLNENCIVTHNTTTATVLAQKLCGDGLKLMKDSVNVNRLKQGMAVATNEVSDLIKAFAVKIESKESVRHIASISANNDDFIGGLIADAYEKIGKHGVISIDNSSNTETHIEYVDGYQFDRGLITPYFITDGEKMRSVLDNPYIIITDHILTRAADFKDIMDEISKTGRPVLIICDDMETGCVQDFLRNHVSGYIRVAVVKAPEFGDRRYDMLQDLCTITGATFVSKEKGDSISDLTLANLGEANSVTIDMEDTTIVGGQGATEDITQRVNEIKAFMEDKKGFELDVLEKRLGKLTGGAAVIRIGAKSEVDLNELKDRVEDALHAVKAAIEEGILIGGGAFLYRISKRQYPFQIDLSQEDESFVKGFNLVIDSLKEPLVTILTNGEMLERLSQLDEVIVGNDDTGINVLTGEIVNMFNEGIVDPAKVVRSTVENSVSVASTLLLTEVIVLGDDYSEKTPHDLF